MRAAANQNITTDWWDMRISEFDLFVSELVVVEAGLGNPKAAAKWMAIIEEIPALKITEEVRMLGRVLISEGPIPARAEIDAYHIAVATVNGIEFLLTWDCAHIANAVMRPVIEATCRRHGFEPPVICTPQELMED